MKNLFVIPVLFFLAILFTGCPYESNVALDSSPKMKINSDLVGNWYLTSMSETKVVVDKKSEYEYMMTKYTKDSSKVYSLDSKYTAFLSDVSGTIFINLKSIPKDDKGNLSFSNSDAFYIYKIVIDSKSVTLYPVTDYIKDKFDSSEDFKNFVSKYKDLGFFYSTEEIYTKK